MNNNTSPLRRPPLHWRVKRLIVIDIALIILMVGVIYVVHNTPPVSQFHIWSVTNLGTFFIVLFSIDIYRRVKTKA